MKKILLLGGSTQQIPAIEYANKQGYYTVLCDYLSDNPGQHYAEKFYCVSTTDKEAILEVAQKEKVDGIVAYASDPAAPTAAYVAEQMGLPTNPYKSVEILALKNKFREFLKENDFNCPRAQSFATYEMAKESIDTFTFPVMVKPIDSSGSKAVKKVKSLEDFEAAYKAAWNQSQSKQVIIEEFVTMDHEYMIGGDCFVLNGEVVFWGLLNCHRDFNVNPLVPVGKSYPLLISRDRVEKLKREIQRLVDLLEIRFGAFNLEIMFDDKDRVFVIEMGPRNGGNMIPDLLRLITGADMVSATIETALGNMEFDVQANSNKYSFASYNLHSSQNGIFKGINFHKDIEKNIIKKVFYKRVDDYVQYFDSANKSIGILFLKFIDVDNMLFVMNSIEDYILIDIVKEKTIVEGR